MYISPRGAKEECINEYSMELCVLNPHQVHYKDDATLRMQFADSGLHIVIIFPGRHKETNETEPMSLAVNLAQATFMNYAFLIMSDRYASQPLTSMSTIEYYYII